MPKIAIVGASGKLGGATLSALLKHNLAPASDIIALTSSLPGSETWEKLARTHEQDHAQERAQEGGQKGEGGIEVRHARFEDGATFEKALQGVHTLFLVSTPNIALDFGVSMEYDGTAESETETEKVQGETQSGNGKEEGGKRGRESHHKNAIDAAVRAGVKWIVYSSLAFGFGKGAGKGKDTSKAGVMRAHLRTEAYLWSVQAKLKDQHQGQGQDGLRVTILREGLYNESWPLYLGYYPLDDDAAEAGPGSGDGEVEVVKLAGDGKICWTAIHDLGVASALVLTSQTKEGEQQHFADKTVYLSTRPETAKSMTDIAHMVGKAKGKEVKVQIVSRDEHVRYYTEERNMPKDAVEWWVGTYAALEDGECLVDDPTLDTLLGKIGLKPIPVEQTVEEMVKGQGGWKSRQQQEV